MQPFRIGFLLVQGQEATMPYLMVEYRFDPPLTDEALRNAFEALSPASN